MVMDFKNLISNNSYKALYGILFIFVVVIMAFIAALWNRYAATDVTTTRNQLEVINNYLLAIEPNDTSAIDNATCALLNCDNTPIDKVFTSIYDIDGNLLYSNASSSRNNNILSFSKIGDEFKNDTTALRTKSRVNYDAVLQKECVITTTYSEQSQRFVITESSVNNSANLQGFLTEMSPKLILLLLLLITAIACVALLHKHISNIARLRNYIMKLSEDDEVMKFSGGNFSKQNSLKGITDDLYTLYKTKIDIIKQHDIEREQAIEDEKRKLYSKRTLANNLNHEIKTPIGIIIGYLDTLINHPDSDSKTQMSFLKKCLINTQRLQNMVVNIAVINRLEDGSNTIALEDVNVWNVANSAREDLKFTLGEYSITLKLEIEHDIFVRANEMLLYNVFCNLIKNSCFYSGGTSIVLKTTSQNNNFISFSFYDNGVGVPEEALPKIFDRFYRLEKDKNKKSGTGLGLPIVKESITLCGGRISATNRPQGGLEFNFTLPYAEKE